MGPIIVNIREAYFHSLFHQSRFSQTDYFDKNVHIFQINCLIDRRVAPFITYELRIGTEVVGDAIEASIEQ